MTSNLAMIERRPCTARSGHQVSAPIAMCAAAKKEIGRRFRPGVASACDGGLGVADASGAPQTVEMRARRMLERRIRFIGHPDFDDSIATDQILGPMPRLVGPGNGAGNVHARELIPLSADTQDSKFLTREQEVYLFRKMNFLKFQAAQLRDAITPSRARAAELDRIEVLLREADAVRNRIIRSYLGLVVSIVKRFTEPSQDFLDLVSEGNFSLIKASERFDIERGARFSTYATWAIVNNFARRIPKDRTRRVRFGTGREELLQSLTDHRDTARADATAQEQSRYLIGSMLGYLNDREQTIISRRFGLAGDKQTLVQIGQELRISKERVRQLESRALDKLRSLAIMRKLDLTDESTQVAKIVMMDKSSMNGDHSDVVNPPRLTEYQSDEELMRQLALGRPEALGPLHARYTALVYGVAARFLDRPTADEISQEVFLAVWRHAASFDPTRGTFRAWVLQITRSRVLNELRRREPEAPRGFAVR